MAHIEVVCEMLVCVAVRAGVCSEVYSAPKEAYVDPPCFL